MHKHKFIKKCGKVVEVKNFTQGPKLSDGYWWQLESELGSGESVWREVVKPHETKGTLFGYDERAFLALQYK
jgi:hypothetical protein